MLPRSPPDPFTHKTSTGSPVSGSSSITFELVLPPAKLVMRRSEPSRFERYRNSSGSSSVAATLESQRSSRNFSAGEAEVASVILSHSQWNSVGRSLQSYKPQTIANLRYSRD